MKQLTVVVVLALMLLSTSDAQFKTATPKQSAVPQEDVLLEAFSFTTGFLSSAGTMDRTNFYKGVFNAIKSFNDSSYLDLFVTIFGAQSKQLGLSYGKPIWNPAKDLNVFFNAGLLYSTIDTISNGNWLGVPVGARVTYQFSPGIGLSGVIDLVPALALSATQEAIEKFGLTVMGGVGIIVTP